MVPLILLILILYFLILYIMFDILSMKTDQKKNKILLDGIFDSLRSDIISANKNIKNLNEDIIKLQDIILTNQKRISKLEQEVQQLRSGSNSKFY